MQEILTAKQLAEYLQLNEITIYKKAKTEEIPAIRFGKTLRFKKSVIDKWLEIQSGWDSEFEELLAATRRIGQERKITEREIGKAIRKARRVKNA